MIKTSEILRDARGILARGWTQRVGYDDGNYCALGALSLAEHTAESYGMDPRELTTFPYGALERHLAEFGRYATVVGFNDAPSTTKQDVLNLFDKAINSLEERGE